MDDIRLGIAHAAPDSQLQCVLLIASNSRGGIHKIEARQLGIIPVEKLRVEPCRLGTKWFVSTNGRQPNMIHIVRGAESNVFRHFDAECFKVRRGSSAEHVNAK